MKVSNFVRPKGGKVGKQVGRLVLLSRWVSKSRLGTYNADEIRGLLLLKQSYDAKRASELNVCAILEATRSGSLVQRHYGIKLHSRAKVHAARHKFVAIKHVESHYLSQWVSPGNVVGIEKNLILFEHGKYL